MPSNSNATGAGLCRATVENEWRAYERLSPSTRRALQNALFDWSAYALLRVQKRSGKQPYEMPIVVRDWDKRALKKERAQSASPRRRQKKPHGIAQPRRETT